MVILSAALCSRGGKPVIARQFVEITRMRFEALLASFPKLLSPTKQHTYVESDTVRYVFQPMESLYLLMITTKNSNIVEDLDTLRLLAKIVSDICPQVSEESITDAAFELVNAFDEVISMGYREAIGFAGVRANLEMNSHEEKLSQMIRVAKEEEAKQEMKRQAAALRAKKAESASGGSKMQSFGSSSAYVPSSISQGAYGMGNVTNSPKMSPPPTEKVETAKPSAGKKGLILGKKQKDTLNMVAQEEGLDTETISGVKLTAAPVAAPGAVSIPKDPVHIVISEVVSASIQQDGTLANYAVSGQIQIVSRNEDAKFFVQFTQPSTDFKYNPHPQVDKTSWEKNSVIQLKQADRSLPANSAFSAMKYRSNKVEDIAQIPISLTVWPEAGKGGSTNVNLEFEHHGDVELHNVIIIIPLGGQETPEIKNCSVGTHRHNSRRHQLEWEIDSVSAENPSGSFEFDLAKSEPSSFFPTLLTFSANRSLAGVEPVSVVNLVDQSPIRFGTETTVTTDTYEVVADE